MNAPDIAAGTPGEKLRYLNGLEAEESFWDSGQEIAILARDPDATVRERAISFFYHLADPRYIDLLMDLARSDPDLPVRIAAVNALGRYVYDGFVMEDLDESDFQEVQTFLLELHKDLVQPLEIRAAALEALGFITDDEVEELVRAAYAAPEPRMKVSALFAMGRSGTRTWDDVLLAEMQNPDPEIRFEAVRAAGETFMSRGAEKLEQLTNDRDREIRLAAIQALGKAGRPGSRSVLRSLLNSSDEDIRDAAAEALDELDLFESEEFDDDR